MQTRPQSNATPPAPSAGEGSLNPTLRRALECMEVNLDAELARYRRHAKPRPGIMRRFFIRTPDGSGESGPPEILGSTTALLSPAPNAASARALVASGTPAVPADPKASALAVSGDRAPADTADAAPQMAEGLAIRPPAPLAQRPLPEADDPTAIAPAQPPARPADPEALLPESVASAQALLSEADRGGALAPIPEADRERAMLALAGDRAGDYRSLRERRKAEAAEREPWFSPLGIATILVMLSGTIWTYSMTYPEGDRYLRLGAVWDRVAPLVGRDRATETETAASESATGESALEAVAPNLAQDEFVRLDLRVLSTLDAKTPEPEPAPPADLELPELPAVVEPPAPAPPATGSDTPAPEADSPEDNGPTIDPDAPLKTTEIPADGTPYIYVVAPYDGEDSLRAAREAVADAYRREFPGQGQRIQLGALPDRARAEQLARSLRQAGINAELLLPTEGASAGDGTDD